MQRAIHYTEICLNEETELPNPDRNMLTVASRSYSLAQRVTA
jgi:hypothetical protein